MNSSAKKYYSYYVGFTLVVRPRNDDALCLMRYVSLNLTYVFLSQFIHKFKSFSFTRAPGVYDTPSSL